MFENKRCEIAAAAVIRLVNTPVAKGFVAADGYVDWRKVDDRYSMLSGGERALVDLAKHLSNRRPDPHNSCFIYALQRVDVPMQQRVVGEVLDLLEASGFDMGCDG